MISAVPAESETQRLDHPTASQQTFQQYSELNLIGTTDQMSTAGIATAGIAIATRPQQEGSASTRISSHQRLQIAQAEWAKLFQTRPDERVAAGHRPILLSSQNQRLNNPWGDRMLETEGETTRIYSLNVNGLSLDRRGGQFDTLCAIAKETQADVVCCQEHNVDTSQPIVRSILHNILQQYWQRFRLQTGSTQQSFVQWYKPGGTLMYSLGNMTGRILEQHQDHMGRWVIQTMKGFNGRQVSIISAYQAVTDRHGTGLMTVTAQQRNLLVQSQDSLSEPRKAFKRDLRELLQRLTKRGDEIILVGDFNETIDNEFTGLSKILADFHLIDLMRGRATTPFPATYARGKHRLDFGFATRQAASSLKHAGYEAFNERFSTDHRAYFFDFNTTTLFGNSTLSLATPPSRVLQSNNVKQVTQYIREKYRQLEDCNAFRRGNQLMEQGNRHAYAERLDKDIIRASLSAEKKTQKYQSPAWSIALAKARTKVIVLTKCLSMARTGYNFTTEICKHLRDGTSLDDLLPRTKQECVEQLRQAKREVQQIICESFSRREEEQQAKIEALEASARKSDKQQAKIIRRIKRAEALKKLQEAVNRARTTTTRQGVTRLEIPTHTADDPKNCTDWRVIDIPSEIIHHLQTRNQRHFGQAHGTPFTIPPLSTAFQFTGEGIATNEVLSGVFDLPNIDEDVELLLRHLKTSAEMEQIRCTATISDEDLQGKLKVWKESTTTSPSGVHLGHYKALIARHE
jgi:exonuclease III